MNFLSHFYFDRNTANPELVLGCVLPDLVKNANKSWNIHPEKETHLFDESHKLQSILTGWQRHLDVDKYFHTSDFFIEHTQAIREKIAPILEDSEVRPSFMAHISLELMLDSILITLKEINAFHFYDQLAKVERQAVKRFLELNRVTDTARFFRFFDQFLEVNYLHSYSESENLIYALNRICMRLWHNPLNAAHKLQLNEVLLHYQKSLEGCYMNIFDDLDRRLN
ncbi:hypothetical protein GZH53_10000 [Flavihumibacter sp. R14]|nr:hypothetical protein [Flavihumibacter soli]